MYRAVLYYLVFLLCAATVLSAFGVIPYSPLAIVISSLLITLFCYLANKAFAWGFNAQTNIESFLITALILALIIPPPSSPLDTMFLEFAFWGSVLAMASKYILAIRKKHVFNPAAIAVVITAFALGLSPSWWVGTAWMLPFVVAGGLLVTRKILRFDLVLSFAIMAFASISATRIFSGASVSTSLIERIVLDTPLFFFVFVMLTEPLTTPPTRKLRIIYGGLVGILFAPSLHIGSIYSTPELALVIGNIFSYLVSPKAKLLLTLQKKAEVASDVYEFRFDSDIKLSFRPGQYLEWTLSHEKPDSRGNRRYFTIASSPTEENIIMGVKFYPDSSSFKNRLGKLSQGETLIASGLAGDFTLPEDRSKKLAFIAGGIGITPYRSMIKHMIDTNDKRDAMLLYSARTEADIAYRDIFDEAERMLGIRTAYTLTETGSIAPEWKGNKGYFTGEAITREIPDYKERMFYLSGPHAMVDAFETTLRTLGVSRTHIKKDFFPGFA
jgi:ferredoxin-NADP reductase/Na+-translocating ferredoxin:NAD+ oxidoreductase RnfD subunit